MDKHTTAFNNVHTQLLLQMQINSNIQLTKDLLRSTQTELHEAKEKLTKKHIELEISKINQATTQAGLEATKAKLETSNRDQTVIEAELKKTKTELETSKRNQTATEEELKKTKAKLETSNRDQTVIEAELKKTKTELETAKRNQAITQGTLTTTQKELLTTRLKLEQTMEQLNQSKEDLKTKETQLKSQKENFQQQMLKFGHQIEESFAVHYSQLLNPTPAEIFKSLDMEQQPTNQIAPIKMIEINGIKLEFQRVNELVKSLNNPYSNFELLMNKMKNGQIYYVNHQQLIFKLCLPKNHQKLWINHNINIASLAKKDPNCVVVMNDQLLLLMDNPNNSNAYGIVLEIPNYNINNSKCYLYRKNTNGENFLLKYGWNYNINYDGYKTESNEILFHIILN